MGVMDVVAEFLVHLIVVNSLPILDHTISVECMYILSPLHGFHVIILQKTRQCYNYGLSIKSHLVTSPPDIKATNIDFLVVFPVKQLNLQAALYTPQVQR